MSRFCIQVSWDEVPHLSEQQKAELESSYPLHEREARRKGIPSLGSGKIYPIEESLLLIDPIEIPDHWARGYGMDVGWNRTAALFAAHDRDTDIVYFTDEYYAGHQAPAMHAHTIKLKGGDWMTGAIDPAAEKSISNQHDGTRILEEYEELGLNLVKADNAREAGILACYNRMTSGRLKVFKTCQNWLSEFRIYRRNEKGLVVKENDHCLHPDTIVRTRKGPVPIKKLVGTEGEVLTIGGEWVPYRHCRMTAKNQPTVRVSFDDGSSVICTPDHRFLTPSGWIEARDMDGEHCYNAVSQTIHGNQCLSGRKSLLNYVRSSWGVGIIKPDAILPAKDKASIGQCGRSITVGEASPKGMTSTTRTKTRRTTIRKIWNSLKDPIISVFTTAATEEASLRKPRKQLGPGIGRQMVGSGMRNITRALSMLCISALRQIALTARRNSKPIMAEQSISFAPTTAKHSPDVFPGLMTSIEHALNAELHSDRTSTAESRPVPENAPELLAVVSVRESRRSDVYCLEVPSTHCFAVESGAVVHNCMDSMRYYIMSGLGVSKTKPSKNEWDWTPALQGAGGWMGG